MAYWNLNEDITEFLHESLLVFPPWLFPPPRFYWRPHPSILERPTLHRLRSLRPSQNIQSEMKKKYENKIKDNNHKIRNNDSDNIRVARLNVGVIILQRINSVLKTLTFLIFTIIINIFIIINNNLEI